MPSGKQIDFPDQLKLFYTYAMRELSKPSCLVITKVPCAKQNKVSGVSTILTSFLCKATPQQTPQTATSSLSRP